MALTDAQLFEIVTEYSSLGFHRTGTEVDHATVVWLGRRLDHLGLGVEQQSVEFDRWEVTSRLTVDDTDVDHLPVYYEWTGALTTDAAHVASFDPRHGALIESLASLAEAAKGRGAEALILATKHPLGDLVAVNRVAEVQAGLPTVLVAGRDLRRLERGRPRLEIVASIVPGRTTNLVATTGSPESPILLTTPLTGWYTCAGERGTGIAVLLDLIERLAPKSLLVVATGGHELDYLGARHWVERTESSPRAIIHIGASMAVDHDAGAGSRELIDTRVAVTSLVDDQARPTARELAAIGLDLRSGSERWRGESEVFCTLNAPLLSFTGAGLDFHTPSDIPGRNTSPGSLRRVADAVALAANEFEIAARNP